MVHCAHNEENGEEDVLADEERKFVSHLAFINLTLLP